MTGAAIVARHEFVGITAAWDASSRITESTSKIGKIGRYHLCEEFSHVRLSCSTSTGWSGTGRRSTTASSRPR